MDCFIIILYTIQHVAIYLSIDGLWDSDISHSDALSITVFELPSADLGAFNDSGTSLASA